MNETGDESYFTDRLLHTMKAGLDLEFYAKSPYATSTLKVSVSKFTGTDWSLNTDTVDGITKFNDLFVYGTDASKYEVAIIVEDEGEIVERWIVSLKTGYKNTANENSYIEDYLATKSEYIYGFASAAAYENIVSFEYISLQDGYRGDAPSTAMTEEAYSYFKNKADITFDYINSGSHTANRNYITANILETRKDCLGFYAPAYDCLLASDVPLSNKDTIVSNIIVDRNLLDNSNRVAYYGQWVQKYDRYLDKNIWVPIDGDIAGNKVRLNTEQDVFIPLAGIEEGLLRNIVKLAFNPDDNQQNTLYKAGVNYVVNEPGIGTYIGSQRTLWNLDVGVARLNVRDLYRVIESTLVNTAKAYLNKLGTDARKQRYVTEVTPFIEDYKTRGALEDYAIKLNDTPSNVLDVSFSLVGVLGIEDITIRVYDTPSGTVASEVLQSNA